MKKTLSFLLVAIICVSAIIAFIPTVEASAATSFDLLFPVDNGGSVYCVYGYSNRYYNNSKFHTGLDIHAKSGGDDTIYSAVEGVVTKVSNNCSHVNAANTSSSSYGNCSHGYGNVIYVKATKSDGTTYELIYAHLKQNSILVQVGQSVRKGQALATMGSSGNSTGKHLHFQVNSGGTTVNINPNGGVVSYSYTGYGCDCEELNDYADDGKCNSCGTYFNFEATKTDKKSIFATITKVSPSTTPYQATQDKSTTLKAGTAVEVLGKYKNAFDHVWYKVSYGNGKTGYLPDGYVREVAPTILPSYVLATATTKTEVMSLPCSTKTNSTSYEVAILSKGESFDVTQIVINTAGNYWYKVKTASGDEGWVWCEETKVKSFDKEPNSIIIGSDFPTTIPKAGRHVDYKVQTTYSNIKSVKGAIYNGTATSGTAVCSSTLDAGQKKSINLYGTSLDNALTFGSLTEGKQYTLVITANLVYGYYDYDSGNFRSYEYPVSKAWTFTVKSSSSSSCSHTYDNACDTTCNKCGATRSTSHTYTNACDTSCNTCGYTRSITHTYSSECDELCNICGAKRIIYDSAHSYKYMYLNEQKHTEECTMCGRKTEILHNPGTNVIKYTHYNSNQHWFLCKNCEEYFEYLNHYYSNSCDETCNGCDYTRTISHTYSNACDTSCNVCGATRATTHVYDNACDTACNVCGETRATNHRYLNACDTTCDVCGAVRSVPDHVYDHDCDTSCNNCGYSRPTSHTYDNNCDGECNVCGAIRSVSHLYGSSYLSDKNMHWRQCNLCGYKGYSENHIPGAAATETNPQICIICSFVIQPPLGHITHNYSSQYQKNDSQHWYECSCGAKKNIQAHQYDNDCDTGCNTCGYVRITTHVFSNDCDTECNKCEYTRETEHAFDNGTVTKEPTANEKGEITYICTVCGEKKYQDIDIISGNDDNSDDKKPAVGETPNDDKNSGEGVDMPIVIAISVSAAAVTATGTALLIRRKTPKSKVIENNESKEDNIGESISEENESKDEEK